MKKDMKLDMGQIKEKAAKLAKAESKHVTFTLILFVLLVYIFAVWNISKLATAEPSQEALDTAQQQHKIPKVDAKAIKQIQSLESDNAQVHSLFNEARNNPFQE
jgi:hypothetical protein